MSLSAVLITHNAASQLSACLESLRFADEIVVVDSGSTDGTLRICKDYGARVIGKEWMGFGPQKQFAVDNAAHEWVLCIDADERVSDALRESIRHELQTPRFEAFQIARRNRFLGRWLGHGEGYPDWSLRLFNRRHAHWTPDPVHERVVANVKVGRIDGDLMHDSAETLDGYLEKQNRYTSLQAEQLHQSGMRGGIARLLFSPLARFLKFYVLRLGFLDGLPGFIHIMIGCMNAFNKYAKLLALGRAGT